MLLSLIQLIFFNSYLVYGYIVIGTIVLLLWIYVERKEYEAKLKCQKQNLKYARVPNPFLSLILRQRFDKKELELSQKYGDVYGGNFVNEFTITISNPELVQIVLNKEFTNFPNRRNFDSNDKLFDNMLFHVNDEKWKRIRAIVSPTFSSGKLRKVKFVIDETVKILINNIEKKLQTDPMINIKEVTGSFSMDTIIQMAYGIKIDSLHEPNNKMIRMAKRIFSNDISFNDIMVFFFGEIMPIINKILGFKFAKESLDYFEKCSIEIIKKKREEMESSPEKIKASNFIELILEVEQEQQAEDKSNGVMENETNKPFKYITNDEIISQCVTFFMVGYDSTATAIMNTLYCLASNPDKQEKLVDEINKTLEQLSEEMNGITDPHQLINFDTLNKFEYLSAAINESLRFYSISLATERTAVSDLRIETSDKKIWFDVKKGDVVRVNLNHLHKNPNNFFKPDQYIPERFLSSENNDGEIFTKSAFMPFGSGPRNCLAKRLALLEVKMALIHLIRLYRFEIDEKRTAPIDFYIFADALFTKDIHLRVSKRN